MQLKFRRSAMAQQLATIRTFQKVSMCEKNRNPGFVPFITDQTFAAATQKKDGRQGQGLPSMTTPRI
jgi:hypothetical protein